MTRLAFGEFQLDPATGELWKEETCVRIQEQPLKLLLCLLERPGKVVGREELQKRVWSGDIHVGFEDGLNAAAWRLRQVLGDCADQPRFIETVPRKGYRFVGQVRPLPGQAPPPLLSFPMPVFRPASGFHPRTVMRSGWMRSPWKLALAGLLGLLTLGGGMMVWGAFKPRPSPLAMTAMVNATGDPAVDYFAYALAQQVAQDLAKVPGLRVIPPGLAAPGRVAEVKGVHFLKWTLAREPRGYRITLSLADAQGQSHGERTFLASHEDLHQVHLQISAYLADRAISRSGLPG
jgi:DNA-binding winged helix-turn-helix (wHTH) protein